MKRDILIGAGKGLIISVGLAIGWMLAWGV